MLLTYSLQKKAIVGTLFELKFFHFVIFTVLILFHYHVQYYY